MAAPKNNKYWENRKKHGREKAIKTPKELWDLACDYFQWCDENPLYSYEPIKSGKNAGKLLPFPLGRPYTWSGLDDYLYSKGVIKSLDQYKENRDDRYKDFVDIITRIEKIIYTQKFEGASVGIFNSNIIARDLGLTDKKELEMPKFDKITLDLGRDLSEHEKD